MAVGDNRIIVQDSLGRTYWYNPKTGNIFARKTDTNPLTGFRVTKDPGSLTGWLVVDEYDPRRDSPDSPRNGTTGEVDGGGITSPWDTGRPGFLPDLPQFPGPGNEPATPPPPPGDGGGGGETPGEGTQAQRDAYQDLLGTLTEWGLEGLADWAWDAILRGLSPTRVLQELREQPLYKERYPENEMREARGFSFMPEAQILAYRNEARRVAQSRGYLNISDQQLANLIGANVSIAEFEHRLATYEKVDQWGPFVKQQFENLLGIRLDDEDLFEIYDPEINTSALDRAYEDALYMMQPVTFGLRPFSQREADLLRAMGVDPDQARQRVAAVSENVPRFQRLAALDREVIGALPTEFGEFLKNAPNELLIQGLVYQNPVALAELQMMGAREVGRTTSGGGVAFSEGAATGLLSPGEG